MMNDTRPLKKDQIKQNVILCLSLWSMLRACHLLIEDMWSQ